jgi:hypothetical protein
MQTAGRFLHRARALFASDLSHAKRSDVKKILNTAALHFVELAGLWEEIHGKA